MTFRGNRPWRAQVRLLCQEGLEHQGRMAETEIYFTRPVQVVWAMTHYPSQGLPHTYLMRQVGCGLKTTQNRHHSVASQILKKAPRALASDTSRFRTMALGGHKDARNSSCHRKGSLSSIIYAVPHVSSPCSYPLSSYAGIPSRRRTRGTQTLRYGRCDHRVASSPYQPGVRGQTGASQGSNSPIVSSSGWFTL